MSPLVFLGIAVGLSLLGVLVLWVRHRPPKSFDAHIRAFSKELEALAPDQPASGQPLTGQPLTGQAPPGQPPRYEPPTGYPGVSLPKRGRRSG